MRRVFFLFCATSLCWSQKMLTVTATPGGMIPVHTAQGHLTVIELPSRIDKVAAESNTFQVEWQDKTVYVYAQQAGAATDLLVWTKQGKVIYELLPPTSDVSQMDVSVETRLPAPLPVVAPHPTEQIPADMMVRARTVEWAGSHKKPKHEAALLVRDVYLERDRLYLRYQVQNNTAEALTVHSPRVVTEVAQSLPPSLATSQVLQIAPERAAGLVGHDGEVLAVFAEESVPGPVPAGKTRLGVVGVQLPTAASRHPLLVRLWLPVQNASSLQATVVVP